MGKRGRKASKKPKWEEMKVMRQAPVPGNEQFYVEKIQRKWISKDGTDIQYYVRWLGWPKTYNTWEHATSFEDCPEILEEFERSWEEKQRKKKKPVKLHKTTSTSKSVLKGTMKKTITKKKQTMPKKNVRRVSSIIKQSSQLKDKKVQNEEEHAAIVPAIDDDTDSEQESPTDDECKKLLMLNVQTAEIKQSNKTELKMIELLHPDLVIHRKHEHVKFLGVTKIQGEVHYLAKFAGDEQLVCFCSKICKAFFDKELLDYLTAVSDFKSGHKRQGEFDLSVEYRLTYRC